MWLTGIRIDSGRRTVLEDWIRLRDR